MTLSFGSELIRSKGRTLKKTVFIHTNAKQMVGAIVGKHSLKRNSANPKEFDVQITVQEDFPLFLDFEGKDFLRGGNWRNDSDDCTSIFRMRLPPISTYCLLGFRVHFGASTVRIATRYCR